MKNHWHSIPISELLNSLNTSKSGLTSAEAKQRLTRNGLNELKETKAISAFAIFLNQFKSLIIGVLVSASIVSLALGEVVDAIAIIAIVILNAIIGFYQEFSAEKSIAALKKLTSPQAKVWRDGVICNIAASEIVVGDVLELEAGDLVGADARLLEAASFKTIESALTGESKSVNKKAVEISNPETPLADRENMIFMGTAISNGNGRAIVVATSMQTEIGNIANLIEAAGANEETPLQQKLQSFGKFLMWSCLGIVTILFVLGLLRGTPIIEMFMTSVSLAVAAVPEGLPTVVTIAFALGVLRMSRRKALIRKLPAVETLGSTNVICTDKTGTLTVGEMTVRALYLDGQQMEVTGEGYEPKGDIQCNGEKLNINTSPSLMAMTNNLLGCNNAHLINEKGTWQIIGDPTEGAMISVGLKAGGKIEQVEIDFPKFHEIPFDSDRKRRCVIRRLPNGKLRAFINGAPDLLLSKCSHHLSNNEMLPLSDFELTKITNANNEMASHALRVLGSAYRDFDSLSEQQLTANFVETDLVFVGLCGMYDPPRPEVKDSINKCHSASIRVVMITGDHPQTAMAIAKDIGIAQNNDLCLTGVEIDKTSDADLQNKITRIAVYARVTAEHKLRIVNAWKSSGAIVAMTGDGVNDAPAIKGADIGIAMGRSGTEVTKQASDMIITDDNFTSIVAAVEEGRGIYNNIRKTLQYLIAGNIGEILLMSICIMMGLPLALLPIHLLWINLVTDGLPAICLATDPIDHSVMKQKPRPKHESIIDSDFYKTMFITGLLSASVSLAVFVYQLKISSIEEARTHAFAVLVFAELFRSFGARSINRPIWKINFFSNINLLIVVVISIAFQILTHHNIYLASFFKTTLIPLHDCLVLIALSTIPLLGIEIFKFFKSK